MSHDLKRLMEDGVVYTVEDTDEFVHFATSSSKALIKHIKRNRTRYDNGRYIVCEYPSTRSLVPTSVRTVATFVTEFSSKDTWRLGDMIKKFVS